MSMRAWTLDLRYQSPPLRENDRKHWRAKAPITREIRERAAWRARAAGIPRLTRCQVHLVWSVTDKRRRDSAAPNPTLKAAIDGLVDAGVVADDHHGIVVRSWCEIEHAAEPGVALVIEEIGEAA